MNIKENIDKLKDYKAFISSADDYFLSKRISLKDSYLKWGTACDSHATAQDKMEYISKAEQLFIEKHKQEILNLAVELIDKDLGEFK